MVKWLRKPCILCFGLIISVIIALTNCCKWINLFFHPQQQQLSRCGRGRARQSEAERGGNICLDSSVGWILMYGPIRVDPCLNIHTQTSRIVFSTCSQSWWLRQHFSFPRKAPCPCWNYKDQSDSCHSFTLMWRRSNFKGFCWLYTEQICVISVTYCISTTSTRESFLPLVYTVCSVMTSST